MTAQRRGAAVIARHFVIPGLLLFIGSLSGCSGIKTYPNTLEKNLLVSTSTESGSIFSKVRASVSIYRVDAQCRTEYEGTVRLDNPSVAVGIPSGRWTYLVFDFSSSGFLSSSSSSVEQATLLKPRADRHYELKVSYRDEIYNVVIQEAAAAGGQVRDIELRRLDACVPG